MDLSVSDIARFVGGILEGKGEARITGVAPLEAAKPSDISFLRSGADKHAQQHYTATKAGVVLVPNDLASNGRTVVRVSDPLAALTVLLNLIEKEKKPSQIGRHSTAVVAADALIGENCFLGPYTVVESGARIEDGARLDAYVFIGARAVVGAQTHLYPHAVVREEVRIGARCVIHSGAVLGADGYGFYFANGRHNKIPQIGTVVVEDDVEIGACTTIDRATIGETRIGRGTKIDNLVQVAHNVEIGEHSLLVAQSGVAGSSRLGKGVVLAGQAAVTDHVTIGDNVQIGGQSGVNDNLPSGGTYWGTPAIPFAERVREIILLRKLPRILKKLKIK